MTSPSRCSGDSDWRIDGGQDLEHKSGMKAKTSITLSEDLITVIDRKAGQMKKSRSEFIETALRVFVHQLARREINSRDLEIINQRAESLNRKAADVLLVAGTGTLAGTCLRLPRQSPLSRATPLAASLERSPPRTMQEPPPEPSR